MIEAVMKTLFEKSPREQAHSERVRDFAIQTAKAAGLAQHLIDDINVMALLHDIGKIIIPSEILDKPGPLNDHEWVEMKKHPEIGARILQSAEPYAGLSEGVRHHHERWDGMGYPDGLQGTDIPLSSRIVGVCDAYDAMTAARPYRKPLGRDLALAEIAKMAGSQFDKKIAELFTEVVMHHGETA